jgi:hypothetical protein
MMDMVWSPYLSNAGKSILRKIINLGQNKESLPNKIPYLKIRLLLLTKPQYSKKQEKGVEPVIKL